LISLKRSADAVADNRERRRVVPMIFILENENYMKCCFGYVIAGCRIFCLISQNKIYELAVLTKAEKNPRGSSCFFH